MLDHIVRARRLSRITRVVLSSRNSRIQKLEIPHTMTVLILMSSTSTCVMFPSLGHHPVMAALRVNRALETMVLKWYIILTTHRNRQLSGEWFKLSKI
jgi:hypothetical protein